MSQFYDSKLVALLDAEAEQFGKYLNDRIKQIFNQPKFRATGALSASVNLKVEKTNGESVPIITVEFNDYGNILNKAKIYWARMPHIQELVNWLLQSGKLSSFTRIPGYKGDSIPAITDENKAIRIAWGLARDKKLHDTWHAKKWRGKAMKDALIKLNDEVTEIWKEWIELRTKQAIETGQ